MKIRAWPPENTSKQGEGLFKLQNNAGMRTNGYRLAMHKYKVEIRRIILMS